MKVLMLTWEYPPHIIGGLGQHVFDLSRFLSNANICVDILTPRVKNGSDFEREENISIHRIGDFYDEKNHLSSWVFAFNCEIIQTAIKLHTDNKFDVIHAHDWIVGYAGRVLSKILEIPLVTTIHATEHGRYIGLHNPIQQSINEIEQNLVREAKRIICCSQYMQSEICKVFALNADNITVIPNGVDPNQFNQLSDAPLIKFQPNEKIILFIGRLVPEKGIIHLIRAMPRVLNLMSCARLYIGGSGPQLPILKKLVSDLELTDKVIFTGFLSPEQRNLLYKHAHVAVFPSLYEPFGIVALEAMATFTPLIVGGNGGLAEVVTHGVNGLKVDPEDEEQLAQAIITVLENTHLAESFTENGFNTVTTTYNWQDIAAETINVYHSAML